MLACERARALTQLDSNMFVGRRYLKLVAEVAQQVYSSSVAANKIFTLEFDSNFVSIDICGAPLSIYVRELSLRTGTWYKPTVRLVQTKTRLDSGVSRGWMRT